MLNNFTICFKIVPCYSVLPCNSFYKLTGIVKMVDTLNSGRVLKLMCGILTSVRRSGLQNL